MHSGDRWRLGHRPGLDGLRGVAILLVVAAHAGIPGMMHAGAVGVTMFFALSGFLIATLLLEEGARTGRISFQGFYRRRAARLLPALVVMLAAVTAIDFALPAFTKADVQLGSLLYVANWVRLADHSQMDALAHTWSLAIEEQFYLVVPFIVLALRRRPRHLAALAICGAVLSSAENLYFVLNGAPDRAHFGTDTQAAPLLVGVALAALLHRSGPPQLARVARSWLVAGGMLTLTWSVAHGSEVLGATIVGVAAAGLIVATLTRPGILRSHLLVWIGRRSYGLYLWHYPLLKLAIRSEVPWTVSAPVAVALACGISAASYRWVEQPFLRRRSADEAPDAREGLRWGGAVDERHQARYVGDTAGL